MGLSAGAVMARDPSPVLRIPLEPMGFQVLSQDFLLAGSSMLTVDFVDNDHLLITFGVRRLMKRDPNEPVDGDDRTVGAYLVELPSGKVLAQTEWRLHDRGKYLWSLGHGRFLLRVRDRLTTFAPMADPDGEVRYGGFGGSGHSGFSPSRQMMWMRHGDRGVAMSFADTRAA